MRILAYDIVYDERTVEWNVDINAIKAYNDYKNNVAADHSIWRFGDFMTFNSTIPTEFEVQLVGYTNQDYIDHIEDIERLVKAEIKTKTTRDVKSFKLKII